MIDRCFLTQLLELLMKFYTLVDTYFDEGANFVEHPIQKFVSNFFML